jgi:hypothetical protein
MRLLVLVLVLVGTDGSVVMIVVDLGEKWDW